MTLDDLPLFNFDPTPAHNGTDTSFDAAQQIKPHVSQLQRSILNLITNSPSGLTCFEVEQHLGLKHQTASARLNELANAQPPLVIHLTDPDTGKPYRRGRSRIYFAPSHTPTQTVNP